MGNFKQEIKKEIPEVGKVISSYDELEEVWKPPIGVIKLEEIREMNKFVRAVVVEVSRITPSIKIREIEFGFVIDGKKVGFVANIENIKENNKEVA